MIPDEAIVTIPAHVPPDLVVDVDFYNLPGAATDVFGAWKAQLDHWRTLRDGRAPLVWTPRNGGHWIAANGGDVEVLFAETEHLSNRSISIPAYGGLKLLPGQCDGEEHAIFRATVMKNFTPKAIQDMRGPIRKIAEDLVAGIAPRGRCDFVADMAYRLPIILFLSMMGLPLEDGEYLLDKAHRAIRSTDEHDKFAALHAMFDYLQRVVAERRASPGEDLISRLHQTEVRGARVSVEAVHGISVNLLVGGLDTVASMLGFIIQLLARDDALRRRLAADPSLLDSGLNEIMRRFPIAILARVVAKDFDYGGLTLKAGEQLLLPPALHSFDDTLFDDPMALRLDRNPGSILTFGRGSHQCLGSYLARVELSEILSAWLRRIPEFHLAPGAEMTIACGPINALKSLPLEWAASVGDRAR